MKEMLGLFVSIGVRKKGRVVVLNSRVRGKVVVEEGVGGERFRGIGWVCEVGSGVRDNGMDLSRERVVGVVWMRRWIWL